MGGTYQNSEGFERRRQEIIDELAGFYADDLITTEDFETRIDRANAAGSLAELHAVTRDLKPADEDRPVYRDQTGSYDIDEAAEEDRMICVLGEQAHQLTPAANDSTAVTVLGSQKLYVRDEDVPPGVCEVKMFNLLGETKIFVPFGVRVESKMAVILGEVKGRGDRAKPMKSDRVIRLVGACVLGAVQVVSE